MLEISLGTNVLARCLNDPDEASSIAAEQKSNLINRNFKLLLEHSRSHQYAKLVAEVATNYILVPTMGHCSKCVYLPSSDNAIKEFCGTLL